LKFDELEIFFAETGLSLAQMIAGAPIESAPQIDLWQKEYTYGKESIQSCGPQQTWNANVHDKQMVHGSVCQKSR